MPANPVPNRASDFRRSQEYRDYLALALQGKLERFSVHSGWARSATPEEIEAGNFEQGPRGMMLVPTTETKVLRRINTSVKNSQKGK